MQQCLKGAIMCIINLKAGMSLKIKNKNIYLYYFLSHKVLMK